MGLTRSGDELVLDRRAAVKPVMGAAQLSISIIDEDATTTTTSVDRRYKVFSQKNSAFLAGLLGTLCYASCRFKVGAIRYKRWKEIFNVQVTACSTRNTKTIPSVYDFIARLSTCECTCYVACKTNNMYMYIAFCQARRREGGLD